MMTIGKILRIILVLQIASQIYELFYMPPLQGYNSLGLANRVSGIFVHASAAGAFASVNYLFLILYKNDIGGKTFRYTFVMVIASQVMAMSSTGIAILLTLYFFETFKSSKNIKFICVIFMLLCPLIFLNLDFWAGRDDGDSKISGDTRVEIMDKKVDNMELFSTKFGLATNTAVNMKLRNSEIVDSSFTSILSNVGLLGLLYISIPLIWLFLYSVNIGNIRLMSTIIWILGVSIPIITMEVFPFNILIVILLNYWLLKLKHKQTMMVYKR